MTPPDAWDECGGCGHDRDDHRNGGCNGPVMLGLCDCEHFREDPQRRGSSCSPPRLPPCESVFA